MKKIIIRKIPNNVALPATNLPPLLQRIYLARGIVAADELQNDLKYLLPYQDLLAIDKAISCLYTALQQQQRVLIIGDYDVDGATSTALAVRVLKTFGLQNIDYLVPDRFQYGYGLTPEIVAVAAQKNPDLIITVDNGIASGDGVVAANKLGIKVLVTDHHLAGKELPLAAAIVNPNQPQDKFSSKNLAGVGVIFYVMLALRSYLRAQKWFTTKNIPEPNMAQFLDLVALGTVADVVNLDKNNRILVYQGLQRIRAGKCCDGIKALLKIAKRNYSNITANDLGYAVGPRLNAAGRLENMAVGIECLLADDQARAYNMATQLNNLNDERRVIEADMHQQASQALAKLQLDKELPVGLCLFDSAWHQGVVGILASRLKDKLHRPVIAFAKADKNTIKGSARSVSGLHIRDALENIAIQHPNLITKFGGHAMAAGLSLALDKYQDFCAAFDKEVSRQINPEDLYGRIYTDGELTAADMNLDIAELIRNAGPWGQGFPEPMFVGKFDIVQQRLVGQKHLRLSLNIPGDPKIINAIAFNIDTSIWPNERCNIITAIFRLDVNEYQELRSLQLVIECIEPPI